MGRITSHRRSYDGERTELVILSEWVENFGAMPEIGNMIVTPTHTGTITELGPVDQENDTAIVIFESYLKTGKSKKRKKAPCKEYAAQARRIAIQDRMDVVNSHY